MHCALGLPIVVASLKGTRPELPSVLLNSHFDVVPVCTPPQPFSLRLLPSPFYQFYHSIDYL
jgi:acetylornithine deacetylase/succinyl-diaminopimelate desuccinylase-like protein